MAPVSPDARSLRLTHATFLGQPVPPRHQGKAVLCGFCHFSGDGSFFVKSDNAGA